MLTTQIVLVPGFWLGAWAWDDVAGRLRGDGFDVLALTLPGLDDGTGQDLGAVRLQDHVDAIVAALDNGADRRVLVVHSGAAVPGTMVLDQHRELVDHIVFVDTAPVRDGFALDPDLEGNALPLESAWDSEMADGSMRDLSPDQLDTFRDRAVAEPAGAVREPARLTNPARLAVPGTVICTSFPAADFRSYAESGTPFLAGLLDHTALELVDLPTGHWPMWSKPAELADLIAAAATPDQPAARD